jgi:pimeloyl-ACP methyl ester carboxylesterase
MGISQWWLVSALVSAELWNKIKWDILFYPAFSIQDTVKGIYKSLNQVPATYNFLWQITLGKKYAEDIWNYDVYDKIKNDEKKILIVHWDRDLIGPFTAVQKADEIYKNSELHIMTWAEHWFSGKYFMDAVEYATKYLKDISILK